MGLRFRHGYLLAGKVKPLLMKPLRRCSNARSGIFGVGDDGGDPQASLCPQLVPLALYVGLSPLSSAKISGRVGLNARLHEPKVVAIRIENDAQRQLAL